MDKEKKIIGLHRNVFFLGLVSFFNDASNQLIQSVMPAYFSTVLGIPPFFVGLIEGASDAISSFARVFSGWFSDKIKRRKLPSIFGYALSVATRPFFTIISGFNDAFLLRMVDRAGKGFREPPRDALIVESVEKKDLGVSFGFQRAMDAAGSLIGPLLAIWFVKLYDGDYQRFFVFSFWLGLFAVLTYVLVKEKRDSSESEGIVAEELDFRLIKRNKELLLFVASAFIFGLGELPIALMLLRPIEIGIGTLNVPLMYFLYGLAFTLAAIPFGKWSSKVGERIVIVIGFLAAIVAYSVLAATASFWPTIVAFALYGLYPAAAEGARKILIAKLVEPQLLATGQGLLQTAIGVSSLFAGVIGGALWTKFGAQTAFVYGATMSFTGLFVFSLVSFNNFFRKIRRPA
ncbi:MAG TPA: MFS transporter [Candidatus Colwellbacteria bacterium]|nr:MFS transporter [Candidatus Colwellbacteria bacterium]